LTAEVKATLPPGAEMNPKLHLLRRHGFSQTTRDLVCHANPIRLASLANLPPWGRENSSHRF